MNRNPRRQYMWSAAEISWQAAKQNLDVAGIKQLMQRNVFQGLQQSFVFMFLGGISGESLSYVIERKRGMLKGSEDGYGKVFEFGPGKVGESFGYESVNRREEGKVLFEL